jgi:hypothetical protein
VEVASSPLAFLVRQHITSSLNAVDLEGAYFERLSNVQQHTLLRLFRTLRVSYRIGVPGGCSRLRVGRYHRLDREGGRRVSAAGNGGKAWPESGGLERRVWIHLCAAG